MSDDVPIEEYARSVAGDDNYDHAPLIHELCDEIAAMKAENIAARFLLTALRTGLDLIEGPKVGAEWKRGCRDFRLAAIAAIAKAEGRE